MVCDWKCIDFSWLYHCSPLIKKYGNKVYKKSLDTDDIDFDDMGPEIVPFEEETKEEE